METLLIAAGTIFAIRFVKNLFTTNDKIERIFDEEIYLPRQAAKSQKTPVGK
jgi:hypothetical protein